MRPILSSRKDKLEIGYKSQRRPPILAEKTDVVGIRLTGLGRPGKPERIVYLSHYPLLPVLILHTDQEVVLGHLPEFMLHCRAQMKYPCCQFLLVVGALVAFALIVSPLRV